MMQNQTGRWVVGALAAAGLLTPGVAMAASVSYDDTFSMQLARPQVYYTAAAAVVGDNGYTNNTYSNSTVVSLSQFDTLGGTRTLESVRLNLEMNILGELYVYSIAPRALTYGADAAQPAAAIAHDTEVSLSGSAIAGSLEAEADFDKLYGTGGTNYYLPIDETADGTDSGGPAFDFIGDGDIDISVLASVMVDYLNTGKGPGNAGNAGNAAGIIASGTVELVYTYSTGGTEPNVPPNPGVIPTPAAAGIGLAMLGGLLGRRRR